MAATPNFLKPWHFRLLLASSLVINFLGLALPLMTMQVYDRILSNRAVDTLILLSAGVLAFAVADFILRICRSVIVGMNGIHFEHAASCAALERLMNTEPRNLHGIADSTLVQDIGAAARMKDYYGGQMLVTLVVDTPFILLFLSLITYLAGWLVCVPLALISLFFLISLKLGKKMQHLVQQRECHDDRRYDYVATTLGVVHTVKALCLEAITVRRFEDLQQKSGQVNYRIACIQGHASTASYGFSQLLTVLMICLGAPIVISGGLSVGSLIACVLLSGQIMQPMQRGLALWISFQTIIPAKKRLEGLLTLPQRSFPEERNDNEPYFGDVRLKDVNFHHAYNEPVFSGVSMEIKPGRTVAIVGAPGSGKSTLLRLIAGLNEPEDGHVWLSGRESSTLHPGERAQKVGYLPSHGTILRGSIMENLTGFDQRLWSNARELATLLGVEDAVSLLPSGYDTPMEGMATDVVPPGLKQRITLVRALIMKPKLVLYDNADQGMDAESYNCIFSLLAQLKGKATLVLVSEDRNILSLAEYIYEIQDKKLVQMAEPSTLRMTRLAQGRSG